MDLPFVDEGKEFGRSYPADDVDKRTAESCLLSRLCYLFVKWVQAFKAEGIDIYAVTPQNEPLNHGNSASVDT